MTQQSATVAGAGPAPATRLEPDAISVAQDTVIGLASSAPAVSLLFSLPLLVAYSAYGSGPILLITAIPMLIIANAYRRLNLWNANCGASFEWVGRAISPYLGFLTGWLMIAGYVIATVSGVWAMGTTILAVFASGTSSTWANIGIATGVGVVMLIIAIVGIKVTARVQVSMAAIEYLILIGFAVAGLVFVLGNHAGTVHVTKDWFSLRGIGGKGNLTSAFLVAVFMYTGWDGTLYVNEEVRHRRINPGRAAMLAVVLLAVIYTFCSIGLQGALSSSKLQASTSEPLTAIASAIGGVHGNGWAQVMALGVALSAIATTGTGIVLGARMVYGMASYRVLPEFLSNVNRRFHTPVAASVVIGLLLIALAWVFLLVTSVQGAFLAIVGASGEIFAIFYVLTALATIAYYRRRVFSSVRDLVTLGILPVLAIAFLVWMVVRNIQTATDPAVNWSLLGVAVTGLVMLAVARFVLRPSFFQIERESEPRQG